jgi:hypothetical protein
MSIHVSAHAHSWPCPFCVLRVWSGRASTTTES